MLTDTHDDTVAKSFQVVGPRLWMFYHIVEHLNCFSMLDFGVEFVAQRLGQTLMDLFPKQPPGRRVVH